MFDEETERRLRREMVDYLQRTTSDQEHPISKDALLYDFPFDGEKFKLVDHQVGIRKPRQTRAALSILTKNDGGRQFNYTDGLGEDGLLRYSWRGHDPNHYQNVSLRRLIGTDIAIPWFMEVAHREYQVVYPTFIVGEEPEQRRFIVALEDTAELYRPDSPVEAALRRYAVKEAKTRIHQPLFRSRVLQAYEDHCAVCNLKHRKLLDAAHIIPDSEGGDPSVVNGLSLCKIHHRAYDVRILGITPDYRVKIREEIRAQSDGPMLEHGLKKLHDVDLMHLPRRRSDRPSRDLLAIQYDRFLSA